MINPTEPPAWIHLVIWQLNGANELEKSAQAQEVLAAFQGLLGQVPGLISMSVGANQLKSEGAWDLGLYMKFESLQALKSYNQMPEHLAIKGLMGPMRQARAMVDFAVEP
jgi:hypothetical protein